MSYLWRSRLMLSIYSGVACCSTYFLSCLFGNCHFTHNLAVATLSNAPENPNLNETEKQPRAWGSEFGWG